MKMKLIKKFDAKIFMKGAYIQNYNRFKKRAIKSYAPFTSQFAYCYAFYADSSQAVWVKNIFYYVFNYYKSSLKFCESLRFPCSTVYRENFAPVLFSPFSPSDLRANLKLGQLNCI